MFVSLHGKIFPLTVINATARPVAVNDCFKHPSQLTLDCLKLAPEQIPTSSSHKLNGDLHFLLSF